MLLKNDTIDNNIIFISSIFNDNDNEFIFIVFRYKEGWIEFEDKIYAKLAEYQLNGNQIGGSKKCPNKDELWNSKYLHKFKWNDLIEDGKKSSRKKLKIEISQSKRDNKKL